MKNDFTATNLNQFRNFIFWYQVRCYQKSNFEI